MQWKRSFYTIAALFAICISVLISACADDKGKNIPDVSHISIDLTINRFEQELFAIDTSQMAEGLQALKAKYPDFSELYFTKIMGVKMELIDEQQFVAAIKGLIQFPSLRKLNDTVQTVYGDFSDLRNDFQEAFKYYKYHFPDRPTPQIYTLISEYTYGAFVADNNILGLGLDFGLGADYPQYNPQFFPAYIKRSMNKDHMVKLALEALIDDLAAKPNGNRLIDMMIHNGKKLYILDQLLPYAHDSIKLAYTPAQVNWCQENENQIWAHFLTEDLLYSTKYDDIRKLVDYSPNSPGMPREAPGRTANWMGWQIVRAYMNKHPKTSMDQLLALNDAQILLEKARYKPRR